MKAVAKKSLNSQSGLGMIQTLLVVLVAGFFLWSAFKIIPVYSENMYVKSALRSLASGGEKIEDMSDTEITKKLTNFYMVNNVRSEGPTKNIKIEREAEKAVVIVDYETRVPLMYNIDVVVKFENHLDSTNPTQCCKPASSLLKK